MPMTPSTPATRRRHRRRRRRTSRRAASVSLHEGEAETEAARQGIGLSDLARLADAGECRGWGGGGTVGLWVRARVREWERARARARAREWDRARERSGQVTLTLTLTACRRAICGGGWREGRRTAGGAHGWREADAVGARRHVLWGLKLASLRLALRIEHDFFLLLLLLLIGNPRRVASFPFPSSFSSLAPPNPPPLPPPHTPAASGQRPAASSSSPRSRGRARALSLEP